MKNNILCILTIGRLLDSAEQPGKKKKKKKKKMNMKSNKNKKNKKNTNNKRNKTKQNKRVVTMRLPIMLSSTTGRLRVRPYRRCRTAAVVGYAMVGCD